MSSLHFKSEENVRYRFTDDNGKLKELELNQDLSFQVQFNKGRLSCTNHFVWISLEKVNIQIQNDNDDMNTICISDGKRTFAFVVKEKRWKELWTEMEMRLKKPKRKRNKNGKVNNCEPIKTMVVACIKNEKNIEGLLIKSPFKTKKSHEMKSPFFEKKTNMEMDMISSPVIMKSPFGKKKGMNSDSILHSPVKYGKSPSRIPLRHVDMNGECNSDVNGLKKTRRLTRNTCQLSEEESEEEGFLKLPMDNTPDKNSTRLDVLPVLTPTVSKVRESSLLVETTPIKEKVTVDSFKMQHYFQKKEEDFEERYTPEKRIMVAKDISSSSKKRSLEERVINGESSTELKSKSPKDVAGKENVAYVNPIWAKKKIRLEGLKNLGNSCYLNACMQALMSIERLTSLLPSEIWIRHICNNLKIPFIEKTYQALEEPSLLSSKSTFYSRFSKSLMDMTKKEVVDLGPLKQILESRTSMFTGNHQQDVHEVLLAILEELNNDMKAFTTEYLELYEKSKSGTFLSFLKTQKTSKEEVCKHMLIEKEFETTIVRSLVCQSCEYTRESFETHRVVSLDFTTLDMPASIQCDCKRIIVGKVSQTENSNKGRMYFSCTGCKLFKWAENPKNGITPLCDCEKTAIERTSCKENENKGRVFFICASKACKFFQWGPSLQNGTCPEIPKVHLSTLFEKTFASHDVEISCEKCKDGNTATASYTLCTLPPVLLLHFKRFQMNRSGGWLEKRNDAIHIPKEITVSDFPNIEYSSTNGNHRHVLRSVIHHKGTTTSSGHYITDVYDKKSDVWTRYDDSLVMELGKNVPYQGKWCETAYVLVYMEENM